MRFAGIDVGSQEHVVAIVDEASQVLVKPARFGEDAAGYDKLLAILGSNDDVLVVMEATGHYGWNLFATLGDKGFRVACLNPLRTRRFAEEQLARAKTDSVDAIGLARFGAQRRPTPNWVADLLTGELRELIRLHGRLTQDFGDRLRQLHRSVDLVFPEFTRHVRTLDSRLATTILREFPTAKAFSPSCLTHLAELRHGPRHVVGRARALALIEAASQSVGRHQGNAYSMQVRYFCNDIEALRGQIHELYVDIDRIVRDHPIGSLLLTIDPLGPLAVAQILGAVGDPARFRHAGAFTAYVGVVPGTKHSGLRRPSQAPLSPIGNARLRRALWMPTLNAVQHDPWLRDHYQRLRAAGKKPKVALIAVMRKLLTAVYSVAKNRKPYVPRKVGDREHVPTCQPRG